MITVKDFKFAVAELPDDAELMILVPLGCHYATTYEMEDGGKTAYVEQVPDDIGKDQHGRFCIITKDPQKELI